jgi:hypothetical protein
MIENEEQQLMHIMSNLTHKVDALLKLINEINLRNIEVDKEMLELLKITSRKH